MIFLDFDGTIVDVWERYYDVFCISSGGEYLDLQEYIKLKRKLVTDNKLAEFLNIEFPKDYYFRKRELLESDEMLIKDKLIIHQDDLKKFVQENGCKILTMRRNEKNFLKQLEYLKLADLNNQVIVLNPNEELTKTDFINKNYGVGQHIIVGDSEAEYLAGKLSNVRCVCVRTGLRNPEDFVRENRTEIYSSLDVWIKDYRKSDKGGNYAV